MIQKLKSLIFKTQVIRLLVVVAIAGMCLNLSHYNIFKIIKGPVNLDSIAVEDIKDQYIKTEIMYNIGAFYENGSEKNGVKKIDKKYYIIPVGNDEYMCAVFDNKDLSLANEILNDTYAYFGGEINNLTKSLKTEGFIYKMSGDQLNSYYDWFVKSGSLGTTDKAEIAKYALPYKVVLGKSEVYKIYVLTAVAVFGFVYAFYLLIRNLVKRILLHTKKS